MNTKRCTQCHEAKPLDQFHRRLAGSEARQAECQSCGRDRAARYNATHRPSINANQRQWRASHRELFQAAQARYRARHPELAKARTDRWRSRNRVRLALAELVNRVVLTVGYVRAQIRQHTSLRANEVTPAMIRARRLQIMVSRDLAAWGF